MLWVTCCTCVFNQNQVSRNLFIHPSINRSDRFSEALPCCLFGISLGKWRVVWIWVAGQERENWLCDWISGSRRREFHWEGSQAARLMPPTPPTTARDGIMESQVCGPRDRDGIIAILLGHRKCLFVFLWSSKMVGIQIPF